MDKIQEFIKEYPMQVAAASIGSSILGILGSLFAYWRHNSTPKKDSIGPKDAIVITGCDSGFGLALAKHYVLDHNFLIICCFLNDNESQSKGYAELSAMAEANHKHKARLMFRKLDVTSQQDVESLRDFIEDMRKSKKIERLAGLINNAGTFAIGLFDWITSDTNDRIIQVNLIGAMRVTKELLPALIESKGRVVNVSSVAGSLKVAYSVVYSTSKCALSFFGDSLGVELREFGVRVVNMRMGSYAKLTLIMKDWDAQKDKFWSAMSDKQQKFYSKKYFDNTYDAFKKLSMDTSTNSLEANNLFYNFDVALMALDPPTTIDVMSLWMKLFAMMPNHVKISKIVMSLFYGMKPFDQKQAEQDSANQMSTVTTST